MHPRLGVVTLLVPLASLTACGGSPHQDAAASCAQVVRVDGVVFVGSGSPQRLPATTGRTLPAQVPACDDTGDGTANGTAGESTSVEVIDGVDPATAVLWQGSVLVREGEQLPDGVRQELFAPVRCTTDGPFRVAGTWTGVRVPPSRRDPLRPPYRVEAALTEGPADYRRASVVVTVEEATDPRLTSDDVERLLATGGTIEADLHCDDAGGFVADAVRAR